MAKRLVRFGPMVTRVKGSIHYENAPVKEQQILLAGVPVGKITCEYKRSFDTNTPFVADGYEVDLNVPTLNGTDEREWFRVKDYGSARATRAASQAYVVAALSD